MGFDNRKFTLVLFSLFYLFMTYIVMMNILKGGWYNTFFAFLMVTPFLVIILNHCRTYWFGILLGLCAFNVFRIPVPIISSFSVYGLFMGICFMFLLLEKVMTRKKVFITWRSEYAVFTAMSILIIGRVLSDPPASARFGGTGGLSTALPYIFGSIAFVIGYWVVQQMGDWRKNIKITLCLSFVAYLVVHVISRSGIDILGHSVFYAKSFNRQFYLLFSILLVGALNRNNIKLRQFYRISIGVLMLSVFSMVRSAPIQAMGLVWSAAFLYNRFKNAVVFGLVAGIIGLGGLLTVVPFEKLPPSIRRSVSVFMFQKQGETSMGEMGFESSFRDDLFEVAKKEIIENPLFGAGWAFSLTDILSAVQIHEFRDARTSKLAMTGAYHNTTLALAAKNGLPTALLFLTGVFMCFKRLARWAYKNPSGEQKRMVSILLVYAGCIFMMSLVNGSGYEMTVLLVLLGAASALVDINESSITRNSAVVNEKNT